MQQHLVAQCLPGMMCTLVHECFALLNGIHHLAKYFFYTLRIINYHGCFKTDSEQRTFLFKGKPFFGKGTPKTVNHYRYYNRLCFLNNISSAFTTRRKRFSGALRKSNHPAFGQGFSNLSGIRRVQAAPYFSGFCTPGALYS